MKRVHGKHLRDIILVHATWNAVGLISALLYSCGQLGCLGGTAMVVILWTLKVLFDVGECPCLLLNKIRLHHRYMLQSIYRGLVLLLAQLPMQILYFPILLFIAIPFKILIILVPM